MMTQWFGSIRPPHASLEVSPVLPSADGVSSLRTAVFMMNIFMDDPFNDSN